MRWIQGVLFQTLGKSASEIYYAAIRPDERRRMKPATDTIVERVADAGGRRAADRGAAFVPRATLGDRHAHRRLARWCGWILLRVLDRQYGQAFREALTNRWIEPQAAADSMRLTSARDAVLQVLRGDQEGAMVLALELSEESRDPEILAAVRECLSHPATAVRAAAIRAMEAAGQPDSGGHIAA